jgi:hypothetical protein
MEYGVVMADFARYAPQQACSGSLVQLHQPNPNDPKLDLAFSLVKHVARLSNPTYYSVRTTYVVNELNKVKSAPAQLLEPPLTSAKSILGWSLECRLCLSTTPAPAGPLQQPLDQIPEVTPRHSFLPRWQASCSSPSGTFAT